MLIKMLENEDFVTYFNSEKDHLTIVKNGCWPNPEDWSEEETIWCLYYNKQDYLKFKTKKEAEEKVDQINKILSNKMEPLIKDNVYNWFVITLGLREDEAEKYAKFFCDTFGSKNN